MRSVTRRNFCQAAAAGAAWAAACPTALSAGPMSGKIDGGSLPRPTAKQLAWQDLELGMFIHFGMATFSGNVWATPSPDTYAPARLDTDQWMEAARAFGAKYAVFTAKHCAGFMQWQTDLYPYSVKQSKWRSGKGDVLKEFVESCHKYGIKPGIYVSATANAYWGARRCRVQGGKESQAKYSRMVEKMCEEVWSRYGDFTEIWFDGGVMPPRMGGPDIWGLQQKLQPNAIVHDNGAGPHGHQRWGGSESGGVGYPCWATVRNRHTQFEPAPSAGPKDVLHMMKHGHPDGDLWLPAEADPTFNGRWFPAKGKMAAPRSLNNLMRIYYESVGRNANLLINCSPGPDGLVAESHMKRYEEFGREIRRRFGNPVAETQGVGDTVELALKTPARIDHVILMEDIAHGERVREYAIEGLVPGNKWEKLGDGISIGHKRIQGFEPAEVARVRFRATKSVAAPMIRRFAAFSTRRAES